MRSKKNRQKVKRFRKKLVPCRKKKGFGNEKKWAQPIRPFKKTAEHTAFFGQIFFDLFCPAGINSGY
jgi:hypothetical protein